MTTPTIRTTMATDVEPTIAAMVLAFRWGHRRPSFRCSADLGNATGIIIVPGVFGELENFSTILS